MYLEEHAGLALADKIELAILDRIALLTTNPAAGHYRRDLTAENVRFFPVYSYLIVYKPETTPLQVAAILHGRRDLAEILKARI